MLLVYFNVTLKSTIVATLSFCIFDSLLLIFSASSIERSLKNPQLKTLRDLLDEVDKYNEVARDLIANFSAMKQLKFAGAPVSENNHQHFQDALAKMKDDLVRALTIERIFRQNPRANIDRINLDFTPVRALQMVELASDYGDRVNALVEISTNIQNEINSLRSGR